MFPIMNETAMQLIKTKSNMFLEINSLLQMLYGTVLVIHKAAIIEMN